MRKVSVFLWIIMAVMLSTACNLSSQPPATYTPEVTAAQGSLPVGVTPSIAPAPLRTPGSPILDDGGDPLFINPALEAGLVDLAGNSYVAVIQIGVLKNLNDGNSGWALLNQLDVGSNPTGIENFLTALNVGGQVVVPPAVPPHLQLQIQKTDGTTQQLILYLDGLVYVAGTIPELGNNAIEMGPFFNDVIRDYVGTQQPDLLNLLDFGG